MHCVRFSLSEENKEKQKEIEAICAPIIKKVYEGAGAGGEAPGGGEAHDEL